MEWDVTPPAQNLPSLVATHNSGLVIGPTAGRLGVDLAR